MFIASYKPSHMNRNGKAFQFVTETQEQAIAEMEKRGYTPRGCVHASAAQGYRKSERADFIYAHTEDYSIIRIRPIEVV